MTPRARPLPARRRFCTGLRWSHVNVEALAYGIPPRPQHASHRRADDHDRWRGGAVRRPETPTADETRADCPEVVGRASLEIERAEGVDLLLAGPVDRERMALVSPEGHARNRCRSHDARQAGCRLRQPAFHVDPLGAGLTLIAPTVFVDHDDGVDVVAQVHVARLLQASHEESGADQQQHGKRHLGHEQAQSACGCPASRSCGRRHRAA